MINLQCIHHKQQFKVMATNCGIGDGVKQENLDKVEAETTSGEVKEEEELQGHWKSMEARLKSRRTIAKGEGVKQGRSPRLPSAWDHEVV